MLNEVLQKPLKRLNRALIQKDIYRFDGFDDYATLGYRAINVDGDIDIEFKTGSYVLHGGVDRTVISQCSTSNFSNKEFSLYFNQSAASFQVQLGGTYFPSFPQATLKPNTTYRWTLIGSTQTCYVDGVLVRQDVITRGTFREPSSQTVLMAQTHGSSTTFRAYAVGAFFDIKINGVLYPMDIKNQPIQLPSPSNLGVELITQSVLENPANKGTQWTYLGNGRWQYVGDGTYNGLNPISYTNQPEAGYLEFEIEAVTGVITCNSIGSTNAQFSTTGVKRYFYTQKSNITPEGNAVTFKRAITGQPASCIIKNISFKPLYSVSDNELVANGDFSGGTTGWFSYNAAGFTVSGGQATLSTIAGQSSRFEQAVTLEAGAYYEISMQVIALSGNTETDLNLARGAAGSYASISRLKSPTIGRVSFVALAPASDAIIQVRGDGVNAGTVVVDNVSIRKLDTLCNPMQMFNKSNIWWSSTDAIVRDVYVNDGVDDHGVLPYRAINPDGDNSYSFLTPTEVSTRQHIITQSDTANLASAEFLLYVLTGSLFINRGGTISNLGSVSPSTRYTINQVGNNLTLLQDDSVLRVVNAGLGTAREPNAQTRIGGRFSSGSLVNCFIGVQRDIKINGTTWAIGDKGQAIQLPNPTGLGDELITTAVLENPASKGTQWTYLGDGRWQYVGDGSANGLNLLSFESQPVSGFVEFEVESISGGEMRCSVSSTPNNASNPRFNTVGIKRYYYTTKDSTNWFGFSRSSGSTTCIIKNISFKPLMTLGAELFSGVTDQIQAGWGYSNSILTASNVPAYQPSTSFVIPTLTEGRTYLLEYNVLSITGAVRAQITGGTPANLLAGTTTGIQRLMFVANAGNQRVGFQATTANTSCQLTGFSLKAVDSLCNPLTLVNTTSDRWREIGDNEDY